MKRLLFAIAALACFALPAHAQTYCDQSATATEAAAATTTVVSAVATGSGRIFICGYAVSISAGTSPTAQLSYGATCAAAGTAITPVYANVGTNVLDTSPMWRGITVPNGSSVCLTAGGTTPSASATVYYTIR